MRDPIFDLKNFYSSKLGRLTRRILLDRIRRFWPNLSGLELVGSGYALPYLRSFREESSRTIALISRQQDQQIWPQEGPNCVCISDPLSSPIASNSIDRILIIHDLEFNAAPQAYLQEIGRILKSNGRALIIVPNRSGLWAHAERTPFGHGTPYSLAQLQRQIQDSPLQCERSEEALFVPPLKFSPLLKYAGFFEDIGSKYIPIAAGIHMVEVSKQTHAKIKPDGGSKMKIKSPSVLLPQSVNNTPANRRRVTIKKEIAPPCLKK